MSNTGSLTELIQRMQVTRDRAAADAVFAAAAGHLRSLARKVMSREASNGSFGVSDLVQELYVQKAARLGAVNLVVNREHFFSLMARGMRQILIDRGRRRRAAKRVEPESSAQSMSAPDAELVLLRQLKERFRELDPAAHRVLALRLDQGLTWEEISSHTGLRVSQCRSEYAHALHWLRKRIR